MAQSERSSANDGADDMLLFSNANRMRRASEQKDMAESVDPAGEVGDEQMEAEVEQHLNASASTPQIRPSSHAAVPAGEVKRSIKVIGHGAQSRSFEDSGLVSNSTDGRACENCSEWSA
jgi:hypothetical protein